MRSSSTSINFTTDMQVTGSKSDNPDGFTRLEGGLRLKGVVKVSKPCKPLISVIIVTKNRASVLASAIASVANQRYDNIELIVVDGASRDESVDVLQSYDHAIDYWLSEQDNGVYHAMNKAIDLSSGEWLYFLGSDDEIINCFHKVANCLANHNTVYYGDVYLPTSHRLFAGKFSSYKLMNINIPHQATFYPRQLFQSYRYNTDYFSSADYELNLRCFNDPKWTYTYMPFLIAVYEDSSGLSTQRLDTRFDKDFKQILKINFAPKAYYLYAIRTGLKNFERQFLRRITSSLKQTLLRRP